MTHFKKKNALLSAATIVTSWLFITAAYGQDELDLNGTDMSLEDLVNVKITIASKSEEKISDAPGVISVITQDQLKRFGGTTLGDVLKRVPSFLGTTVYFTDRSVIASRGDQVMPSSSHILLLINGRPIREVLEGGIKSEVYESFPVNVIERIEVIRGPGSVLYGSQAFSAVINVVTKKPDYNCASVSGVLGEGLQSNVNGNINYKIGDFGIVLAGRYGDKGGWKTNWVAPNMAGGNDTVNVTIPDDGPGAFAELTFKGLRLMCSYNQWSNQNFVPDYQIYAHLDTNLLPPELRFLGTVIPEGDATGKISWKKLFSDIGYTHNFNDNYSSSLNATFTRSVFETTMFPWTCRDAYELLVEETNYFKPIDNLNIVFGGTWTFMTGFEGDARIDSVKYNKDHKQNSFSGYLQTDYRWNWCKLIGGIQMNKVADFDFDFNPRGGIIFYPFENVNFKALYSTAYRAPSLDELYLDHPTMRGQMVARLPADSIKERDLSPEKVNTFDFGFNCQNDEVQFGFNIFNSYMKNLIIQDRTGRYAIPTWDNIGEVSIFGLEVEGKYYVSKELFFEGSMLYQESKDESGSGEEHVTPLPVFSAKGGLSYMGRGLTCSFFNTYWQALDKKYSNTRNKETKYFNMLNLNCSYNLNYLLKSSVLKELSLVLTADNLLDEEVWLPAWGMGDVSNRIPYNEGRVIYGGIKVTF
jgi:outer membrane receptor protein involved in Fe transport